MTEQYYKRRIGIDDIESVSMGVTRIRTNIMRTCDGSNRKWPETKIVCAGLDAWVCESLLPNGGCRRNGQKCLLSDSGLRIFGASDEALCDIARRLRSIIGSGDINFLSD